MAFLNKAMLIGNVGKDPEIRMNHNGKKVAKFSLATTEKWRDKQTGQGKESTDWHNIVAWGPQAELIEKLGVCKGTQMYVEGPVRNRSWDDPSGQKKYITEIEIKVIQLLGSRQKSEYDQRQPESNDNNPAYDPSDDDMPF